MDMLAFVWTIGTTIFWVAALPFQAGWTQIVTGEPLHMLSGAVIIAGVYGGLPVAVFRWWRMNY